MSKRWLLFSTALALFSAQAASAQPAPSQRAVFNPYPAISPSPNAVMPHGQPSLSPYLNLLRGGNPAVNFYLDVVPALQKRNKQLEPAIIAPRIDPKLEEEFKEMSGRKSTAGNLPSFMNHYGSYALPNQRGYVPYAPPAVARPVGP